MRIFGRRIKFIRTRWNGWSRGFQFRIINGSVCCQNGLLMHGPYFLDDRIGA